MKKITWCYFKKSKGDFNFPSIFLVVSCSLHKTDKYLSFNLFLSGYMHLYNTQKINF